MPDTPALDTAITEMTALLQRVYDAGANDAMKRVMDAVQSNLKASPASASTPRMTVAARILTDTSSTAPQTRAPHGYVKNMVLSFVECAGKAVTEQEFGVSYPDINRSSRYMAFRNLETEGVIAKRGDAWVLVKRDEGSPAGATAGISLQSNL
jgi:hypothetical protein